MHALYHCFCSYFDSKKPASFCNHHHHGNSCLQTSIYWYSQNHRKSLDTKKSQDEMPHFDNLEDHVNLVQVHLSGEGLRAGRERERRYGGGGQLSIWGGGRSSIREGGRSSIWGVGRFSFCGWRYVSWGGVSLSSGGSVEIILFCSAECIADISLTSWWPSHFIAYTV